MKGDFSIDNQTLTIETVDGLLQNKTSVKLSEAAVGRIDKCRKYLDNKLKEDATPIYGINTGFGALYNKSISAENIEKLQENLVKSHACGMGAPIPKSIVRIMLLLKAQGLSSGHSGVHKETVLRLLYLYNNNLLPVVYEQGSLGASGDLVPLAHLSLPLLGLGEIWNKDQIVDGINTGLEPLTLKSKEGLALLNGTQFMSSYAVWCLIKLRRLMRWSNLISAMSLDAYDGRIEPFLDLVHLVRKHKGQITVAREIRKILEGSEILQSSKMHVQDPYSFRCIPQVHGAVYDTIQYVTSVIEVEINSVTDNPTIFPDEDQIISAGNFHGEPLALVLDQLAIAVAEMGSISERRIYKLLSGTRGLPPFLIAKPGLNSGFMIPQYTAASIVSQNKQFCTPSSVDTIDSSNGQEDYVSMGANAAVKCLKVIDNYEKILSIELLNASQALSFRRPLRSSEKIEAILLDFRKNVPLIENDTINFPLMRLSLKYIKTKNI